MDPLDRIASLLKEEAGPTVAVHLPAAVIEAAGIAHDELGLPDIADLLTEMLRHRLSGALIQATLDDQYTRHPDTRPSLADVTVALAEQDGHPLASTPALIRDAVDAAGNRVSGPREALIWADATVAARKP